MESFPNNDKMINPAGRSAICADLLDIDKMALIRKCENECKMLFIENRQMAMLKSVSNPIDKGSQYSVLLKELRKIQINSGHFPRKVMKPGNNPFELLNLVLKFRKS